MIGKRQFSLAYLLLEVVCFALAMGLTRCVMVANNALLVVLLAIILPLGVASWGAALGGLFGRMLTGATIALYAAMLLTWLALLLPASMT